MQSKQVTVERALPNVIGEKQTEQGETVIVGARVRCQERSCSRCGQRPGPRAPVS